MVGLLCAVVDAVAVAVAVVSQEDDTEAVDDRPLFYFCLETFDESQNVDGAVTLEVLETQVIYSRDCFSRVADFFAQTVAVPGAMLLVDQLELAAIEQ